MQTRPTQGHAGCAWSSSAGDHLPRLRTLFCTATAFVVLCCNASARTWTDVRGRTTEADLVRREGAAVIMKRGGREFRVPTNTLCATDAAFVQTWVAPLQPLVLAQHAVQRGTTNVLVLPLSEQELKLVHDGFEREKIKNPAISNAVVCIALPASFDPEKTYPLLIVSSTSDGSASSVAHMRTYWPSAISAGWVVMAADCQGGKPTNDHDGVRWATVSAGLNALHAAWPASRSWPCATAGFSGGAKRSPRIAALLLKNGYAVSGIYMGGCNEDTTGRALQTYRPSASAFRALRIFVSNGKDDTISTPAHAEGVAASIRKNGFKQVRLEFYDGPHQPSVAHIEAALQWFAAGD